MIATHRGNAVPFELHKIGILIVFRLKNKQYMSATHSGNAVAFALQKRDVFDCF